MIKITLKSHLKRLDAQEVLKEGSNKKRAVPTMDQLAEKVGVHRVTLNRIANNHIKAIKLDVLSSIIETLQDMGFDSDIKDILVYQKGEKQTKLKKNKKAATK